MTPPEICALRPAGGEPNKPGWTVRVVPNRYPALRVEEAWISEARGFYESCTGVGAHEVIIEHPESEKDLHDQPLDSVAALLKTFCGRAHDLERDMRLMHVQIFKNHGAMAGATIRHPHSQLIASPVVPPEVRLRLKQARAYFERTERSLFEDVYRNEVRSGERVVYENSGFLVYCPWASRMPFEMSVLPRRQSPDFPSASEGELMQLADALKTALTRLSASLDGPAYNLVFHTAPVGGARRRRESPSIEHDYRWSIDILPRMGRLAGFEYGTGMHINTVFPEEAAQHMRSVELKKPEQL